MCSLFSVCICPISAAAGGALPLSQMGRTDAAAEVKTDFEPMGRGGRCGEEGAMYDVCKNVGVLVALPLSLLHSTSLSVLLSDLLLG